MRQARGMTIEALAGDAKMHGTYLSGIERGRRNPSWEKLLNLAIILETPLSAIILDAENEAKAADAAAVDAQSPDR